MPLIKTINLTKTYQLGKIDVPALVDVDLEIDTGEFVAIMGPSGSGKSTLLHQIGCLSTPTSGQYFLDGIEITKDVNLAKIRNEKVGFVFQTFNLLPQLTALENVELPLIYKNETTSQRRQRARDLLEMVDLGDRSHHRPNELSGGQQQRVAIARSLACQPPVLLADEPTGNLDSKTGAEIIELLKDLVRQGTTIVVVTHDENISKQTDRIIRLKDGRIVDS